MAVIIYPIDELSWNDKFGLFLIFDVENVFPFGWDKFNWNYFMDRLVCKKHNVQTKNTLMHLGARSWINSCYEMYVQRLSQKHKKVVT